MGRLARWLAGGGHVYPLPKFYFIEDREFYICLPDQDFCEQMAGFVKGWPGRKGRREDVRREEGGEGGRREGKLIIWVYKKSEARIICVK